MEWVETTGRTVEDAKEAALDQLGVDERDAEFEVVEEPRTGLFGRMRGEARVRARVRPIAARPKVERRDRRRRRSEGTKSSAQSKASGQDAAAPEPAHAGAADDGADAAGRSSTSTSTTAAKRRRPRPAGRAQNSAGGTELAGASTEEGSEMTNDVTVEEQATIMRTFLDGLVEAFDFEASISDEKVDDDTIELRVTGDDLGLLIGPKGQTLQAVQELARTVVQRQATGIHHGRVRIDVSGYRQRRREALERFTQQVAESVLRPGVPRALEPMHPGDRKIVHDVVNDLAGVGTTSEGEEPRRRVVIVPEAPASDNS